MLFTHQWFCYATSMQEWYKIQILWGTRDDLLVCGMPVWIVGLFRLSPKDWWYLAVHSRVTWQGTIVHVVAVIWERLDTIIIGTSFYGLCVPHWVTHLEHQMTVERFCHSWTLSTHLWKAFCRVWEVCKQDEHGNQENQGQQQSVNSNFHEDAASPQNCIRSGQIGLPGSKVVATKCLNLLLLPFCTTALPQSQSTVLLERGFPFTKSVLGWRSPKTDGSWHCLSPRDTSWCSMLFFIMPLRLQLNPCPSPLLLLAFAYFR